MAREIVSGLEVCAEPGRVGLRLYGGAWKWLSQDQVSDAVCMLRRAAVEADRRDQVSPEGDAACRDDVCPPVTHGAPGERWHSGWRCGDTPQDGDRDA